MKIIIYHIRKLVKTSIDIGCKIVSCGFVWPWSKKVSDKLEKESYPKKEERVKEKRFSKTVACTHCGEKHEFYPPPIMFAYTSDDKTRRPVYCSDVVITCNTCGINSTYLPDGSPYE